MEDSGEKRRCEAPFSFNYLIAPFVTAGLAAGCFWWRGDEMTLGHYLAMGIAAAVLGFGLWRRQQRSTR